jgi:hypothetical protein
LARFTRLSWQLGFVVALGAILVLGWSTPAFAGYWNTNLTISLAPTSPPSGDWNGAELWVTEKTQPAGSLTWSPNFHPGLGQGQSSMWGTYANCFNINNHWDRLIFGSTSSTHTWVGGPPVSFFSTWHSPASLEPCKKQWAWKFRWVRNNPPFNPLNGWVLSGPSFYTLQWFYMGTQMGSQPSLYNPDIVPDDNGNDVANTTALVVTNVQYAQSPSLIAGSSLSLDNPAVQALFAGSGDTARPGPFTVAPGATLDMSPAPFAVGDLTPGGGTVLMKGEVMTSAGTALPFVIQFAADPAVAATPASSPWSVALLGIVGMIVVAIGADGVRRRLTHD